MDYKHRVPGNRKRKRTVKLISREWLLAGIAVCIVFVAFSLWRGLSSDASRQPQPANPQTTFKALEVPREGQLAQGTNGHTEGKKNSSDEPLNAAGKPAGKDRSGGEQVKPEVDAKGAEGQATTKPEPRFTFYKILPEKEVIIPETELNSMKLDEKLGKIQKPTQYQIQVGSYRSAAEAEKVRGRLSQIKIKSKVESVKLESVVWHRVKIGPFVKVSEADKVRDYLKLHDLPSVLQTSTTADR